ncbi:hypothetical protein ACFVVX_17490 [Kitasatospora sp. NPDC058170]|uniref:hypothetical protein n=1 Tax=Kitasatospora sp. NPDC058170 TaxID=3346364 RepID=UPI0036DA8649
MRKNHLDLAVRRVRGAVPAAVLTAGLVAGLVAGGVTAAAPASATAGPLGLTVHAPASVGFAGQPVEFTETIGNKGDEGFGVALELSLRTDGGAPEKAVSLDFVNSLGDWESIPLTSRTDGDGIVFSGVAGKIIVPPGGTDVRLRVGVPMGTAHNGMSNGGVGPVLTLRTEVKGWWLDHPVEPALSDSHTIKVAAISGRITGVPGTAVAGGAPIEFDAVLGNPSPSAYTNLGQVLFTDERAKLEVRGADGRWTALPAVPRGEDEQGTVGYYLDGRNSSAAPGSATTKRVRVSYPAGMPVGVTALQPCVFVNEGLDRPFHGTTNCSGTVNVQVTEAGPKTPADPTGAPAATPGTGGAGPKPKTTAPAPAPKPAAEITTPAPAATPTAAASAPAAPAAAAGQAVAAAPAAAAPAPAERLATTGADADHTGRIAGAAALLLGAGAAALAGLRRRRRSL